MDNLNNYNFLRLIFASSVIISHSYPLTNHDEIFLSLSNNQFDLGAQCVNCFFVISGFLIIKSLIYSKTITNYFWKRVLRLYPALTILLIMTTLAVIVVNKSNNIFTQKDFYTYIPRNLIFFVGQFKINGVFENNPHPNTINGSLWTLKYEFLMYMLILPFFYLKKNKYLLLGVTVIAYITFSMMYILQIDFFSKYLSLLWLNPNALFRLAAFFLGGSVLALINIKSITKNISVAILILLVFISLYFNIYNNASLILIPLLTIIMGNLYNKYCGNFSHKLGDISYGMYIYGFLVQQILMNYFALTPFELMSYAMIITIPFAYASWHLIEKKAINYKSLIQ